MKEIGQVLREARMEKGLSIQQVSELTRIRSTYLEAIEDGEFTKVPGAVYIKGFLKSFAMAVGVNSAEILEMYHQYEQQNSTDAAKEVREIKMTKPQSPIRFGKIIIVCLVLGALVVGGVFVTRFWSILKNETIPQLRDSEQQTDQPQNSDSSTTDAIAEGTLTSIADENDHNSTINTESSIQQLEEVSATIEATPQVVTQPVEQPASDTLKEGTPALGTAATNIQIIAVQKAWVRIMVDDEVVFADMMYEGDTKTYEGDTIHLRIGNAAGIKVKYNGQLIGPFGEEGKIVEHVFGE